MNRSVPHDLRWDRSDHIQLAGIRKSDPVLALWQDGWNWPVKDARLHADAEPNVLCITTKGVDEKSAM